MLSDKPFSPAPVTIPGIFLVILFSAFLFSCSSTQEPAEEGTQVAETDVLEDPYFHDQPPLQSGELFRVLIDDSGYYFVQLKGEKKIQRREDPHGDEEEHTMLNQFGSKYNFQDWEFDGLLKIRLNATSGDIEHVEYVTGEIPKTWQVSRLFQEDITRHRFDFPGNLVNPRSFLIRYKWRIKREEGLSDEDAKKRAMEFLRSELR